VARHGPNRHADAAPTTQPPTLQRQRSHWWITGDSAGRAASFRTTRERWRRCRDVELAASAAEAAAARRESVKPGRSDTELRR